MDYSKLIIIFLPLILFLSCRAQIINGEKISSEKSYILYQKKEKYSRKEVKDLLQGSPDSGYKKKNDLAVYLIRKGKIDKGTYILYKLTRNSSLNDRVPYLNLGKVFSIAGNHEKLIETYSLMLSHKALNEHEAFVFAKQLFSEKKETESYYLIHSLYMTSENKIQYAFWLAQFHLEKAEFARAVDFYSKILSEDPNNKVALFTTGYIYSMGNDHTRATVYLELAKQHGYNQTAVNYYLARSYFGLGRLNEALNAVRLIPVSAKDFNTAALHGDILIARNFSSDIKFLLRNKKETEKMKLLHHWYRTGFEEDPDRINNDKTKKRFNSGSGHILRTLEASKKEFIQLY
ncbi:MAG: hypothetical protein OEZ34_05010 [Spirochaetia bacterium]|nr:hypothetical protein [Spirochaetia bacterium]